MPVLLSLHDVHEFEHLPHARGVSREARGQRRRRDQRREAPRQPPDDGCELRDGLCQVGGGIGRVLRVGEDSERRDCVPQHRVAVSDGAGEEVEVGLLEDGGSLVHQRLPEVLVQRYLGLLLAASEGNGLGASAHSRVMESEVAFQLVLVVGEGDDGGHQLLVDDRGEEVVDVDYQRPVPPHRVGDVAGVDSDLEQSAHDDAQQRHQTHRHLGDIILDALIGVVHQLCMLRHEVVDPSF
mmetsp:Transcript_19423/g.46968  ORF Transcript_19423/g.46968 Transcript_19423/m.46968 type:complete len:239 (-) Transcript_19423:596-1312(-)